MEIEAAIWLEGTILVAIDIVEFGVLYFLENVIRFPQKDVEISICLVVVQLSFLIILYVII